VTARDQPGQPQVSLASLTPTTSQRRLAHTVAAVLLAVFAATVPFADLPLAEVSAFIPVLAATIIVTDLTTSILLFAQFAVTRSRALLALALGYLFTALMVIPHLLSFPGVFAPQGLLGAGLQTPVWLYIFWHLGLPVAVCAYLWLGDAQGSTETLDGQIRGTIGWSVAVIFCLACGLTLFATVGHDHLPALFLDRTRIAPLSYYFVAFNLAVGAFALAWLWLRQRSVLDIWLIVVMLAWIGEHIFGAVLASDRFDVGWYAGRIYSLVTATIVLAVLLAEITQLYARIARSNMILERERNNKLMNLEAMAASISHEVRQPLSVISITGAAALRFLDHAPPNLEEVRSDLNTMMSQTQLASQVFDNLRALFGKAKQAPERIDMNQLIASVLRSLDGELKGHGVTTRIELTRELPQITGHRGQLQEVLFNLIRNAIEAMESVGDGHRVVQVTTEKPRPDAIAVIVEDSGPGIDPEKLDTLFEAFVTTKSQGMGLGLAICRTIVERHGGQLSASSSEARGGALFHLILPIAAASHDVG
jgi:signal transduction histidine kinase